MVWRPIDHQAAEINLGRERSWYSPNWSTLIIIASPTTLAKLNLEYDLPDQTLRPTGCKQWKDPDRYSTEGQYCASCWTTLPEPQPEEPDALCDLCRKTAPHGSENFIRWKPYQDGTPISLPPNPAAEANRQDLEQHDRVITSDTSCKLKVHCHGQGRIQLHVIQHDILICAQCAAGEEGLSTWEVLDHLKNREYPDSIHSAKSTGHTCQQYR